MFFTQKQKFIFQQKIVDKFVQMCFNGVIDLMTVMENLFCFNATESRRVVRADEKTIAEIPS